MMEKFEVGRFEVFTLALSEIMSNWNKIATEELKPYGLKGGYVVYLIALFKAPHGLTAANLSQMCNRDKAEVSRAVKALELKEFVIRTNTTSTGYRASISLTQKGREVTHSLRERVKLVVEKGGEGLSDSERDIFYNSLEIISKNLKVISEEGLE
ncbi:MAG: hypothetical protein IJD91_04015 [Clostridia bacterium]|nr:hypothetical protein [Clostridia bacterium]